MKEVNQHKRVNDILLGPLERPALHWLAAHMPGWVTPDICTAVGVGGALITLAGYVIEQLQPGLSLAGFPGICHQLVRRQPGRDIGPLSPHRTPDVRLLRRPYHGCAVSQVIICLGMGLTAYVSFDIACLR
jgi:archaetidylinositol phosphate synthase